MAKLLKNKLIALLLALVVLPAGSAMACQCDGDDKDDEEQVVQTN